MTVTHVLASAPTMQVGSYDDSNSVEGSRDHDDGQRNAESPAGPRRGSVSGLGAGGVTSIGKLDMSVAAASSPAPAVMVETPGRTTSKNRNTTGSSSPSSLLGLDVRGGGLGGQSSSVARPASPTDGNSRDANANASAEAGPSRPRPRSGSHPHLGPATTISSSDPQLHEIPPPCTPRKHRSGVLLSRVRARAEHQQYQPSNLPSSRSVGDLAVAGSGGVGSPWSESSGSATRRPSAEGDVDGDEDRRCGEDDAREELVDEFSNLDNSARYYHQNPHSLSGSSSPLRSLKPLTNVNGVATESELQNKLLLRRKLSGSERGAAPKADVDGAPSSPGIDSRSRSSSLFDGLAPPPSLTHGNGLTTDVNANGRLVILTPTTQEWQELGLDNLQALGGQGAAGGAIGSAGGSASDGSGSDFDLVHHRLGGGKHSINSSIDDGHAKRGSWDSVITPPKLIRSDTVHSADALEEPLHETRGPPEAFGPASDDDDLCAGNRSAVDGMITVPAATSATRSIFARTDSHDSGSRDGARSAPPLLEEGDLYARLLELESLRQQDVEHAVDDRPLADTPPTRSRDGGSRPRSPLPHHHHHPHHHPEVHGISRSQSLREPSRPRKEKERERLFREVGEEVQRDGVESAAGSWGIRQIGSGMGLNYIPPTPPPIDRSQSETLLQPSQPPETAQRSASSPLLAPQPRKPTAAALSAPSPLHNQVVVESPSPTAQKISLAPSRPRSRIHSRSPSSSHHLELEAAPLSPITSRRRQSQRLSLLAGRTPQPFAFPAALPPSGPTGNRKPTLGLSAFSPFTPAAAGRSPPKKRETTALDEIRRTVGPLSPIPPHLHNVGRSDSVISIAPSTTAPSEIGSPREETAGGAGGRGIDDYVILDEAGKGAYGLVRRARQKGDDGEPIGEEVIIKYIIKSRILADCWKKHRVLGPIPIEIHVMDQLRNLTYPAPAKPQPWAPERNQTSQHQTETPGKENADDTFKTPTNANDKESFPFGDWHAKISADVVKDRGHPNVCKMLDFFEDREFYYREWRRPASRLCMIDGFLV